MGQEEEKESCPKRNEFQRQIRRSERDETKNDEMRISDQLRITGKERRRKKRRKGDGELEALLIGKETDGRRVMEELLLVERREEEMRIGLGLDEKVMNEVATKYAKEKKNGMPKAEMEAWMHR